MTFGPGHVHESEDVGAESLQVYLDQLQGWKQNR